MSSTFVTRLKVGEILIDAKGVSRLASRQVGIWPLVLFTLAGLGAIAVAVAVSPALRHLIEYLALRCATSWGSADLGMPRAAASRELLAPREDVWAFIAEPHHFPDWWPGIGGVQPDRRGLAEGARWAVTGIERPTLLRRPASSGDAAGHRRRHPGALCLDVDRRSHRRRASARGAGVEPDDRDACCRGALALRLEPRPTTESADSSTRLVPDWCRALGSSPLCSISATTSRPLPRFSSRSSSASWSASRLPHGLGNTERKRLEEDLRRAESQAEVLRATVDSTQRDADRRSCLRGGHLQERDGEQAEGEEDRRALYRFVEKVRRSSITSALADAGAGTPLRIRFVKVPVDPEVLATQLAKKPLLANYAGPDQLKNLGHDLGQEFVAGTDTPLVDRAAERARRGEDRPGSRRRMASSSFVR